MFITMSSEKYLSWLIVTCILTIPGTTSQPLNRQSLTDPSRPSQQPIESSISLPSYLQARETVELKTLCQLNGRSPLVCVSCEIAYLVFMEGRMDSAELAMGRDCCSTEPVYRSCSRITESLLTNTGLGYDQGFEAGNPNLSVDKKARNPFLGKRSERSIEAGKDEQRLMEEIGQGLEEEKRGGRNPFLGKRSVDSGDGEVDMEKFLGENSARLEEEKRGDRNPFLGKRFEGEKETDEDSLTNLEEEKRGGRNPFLGKRTQHPSPSYQRWLAERRSKNPFLGKRANPFLGKRANPFLGKKANPFLGRRANPFLGKRANPFLGKRANPFLGKRANPFLGKRANPFLGKRDELILNHWDNSIEE